MKFKVGDKIKVIEFKPNPKLEGAIGVITSLPNTSSAKLFKANIDEFNYNYFYDYEIVKVNSYLIRERLGIK